VFQELWIIILILYVLVAFPFKVIDTTAAIAAATAAAIIATGIRVFRVDLLIRIHSGPFILLLLELIISFINVLLILWHLGRRRR